MKAKFGFTAGFIVFILVVSGITRNEVGDTYENLPLNMDSRYVVAGLEDATSFSQKLVKAFGTDPILALEFADWVMEASRRHHIKPELIASLILVESSFRKNVESSRGAVGPTQVKPKFWREFCGNNDLYDPEQNVYCGTMVLSYLKDRCKGEHSCALSAYNVGFYGDRWQAGKRYVAKIDRELDTLQNVNL